MVIKINPNLELSPSFRVKPLWSLQSGSQSGLQPINRDNVAPHFLARTKTEYAKGLQQEILFDRGMGENRMFDSLANHLPDGAYIAGGFMTSLLQEDKQATDIDIFFTSEAAFKATYNQLANPDAHLAESERDENWAWFGYKPDFGEEGARPTSLDDLRFVKFVHEKRPPIQLLKLAWYDSAEHIIDSFDLTIAQFAADSKYIYFNPISFLDLARKRIILHRMQFPASTLRRLIKYTKKGYYACEGSLVKISEEVAAAINERPAEINRIVYVD